MRITARFSLVTASLLATGYAQAQPVDERTRLQQDAESAYRRGNHAEALDFAMRAGDLGMTPQLRLFIGVQHEALGHTVEALESAERCVREATSAPTSPVRTQVLDRCNQMVRALEQRVGRVVVLTPDPAPDGLQVRMQGAELERARWRTPVPVRPGSVVVEAVTSEGLSLRREVSVAEGARVEVSVEQIARPPTAVTPPVAPVVTPPIAPAVTPTVTAQPPAVRVLPHVDPMPVVTPRRSIAPWIVAASGGALALAGASLILVRDANVETRDEACPNMSCDSTSLARATSADETARAWQTASYVTMSVGAAVALGGVVWGILSLRSPRATPSQRATWSVTVGPSSVGAIATF